MNRRRTIALAVRGSLFQGEGVLSSGVQAPEFDVQLHTEGVIRGLLHHGIPVDAQSQRTIELLTTLNGPSA